VIADEELADFLEAARVIGKLGRGAEPLLAFLEHWPNVVEVTHLPQAATLPLLMNAVRSLQKSPNGPAVTPLLQTLGAVAGRLRSAEALQHYLTLILDHAQRTAGSIHGFQITQPSPSLAEFLGQTPRLLSLVSLAGLKRWMDDGIRLYGDHPEHQRAYFSLASPDSKAILQRERDGTLFTAVERRLSLTLAALWQDDSQLVPYSTAFSEIRQQPYLASDGMRLPDALDDQGGVSGLARYRAMLAHLAGHRRWSQPLVADNWSPLQRMAVETLEDARIDTLLLRRFPGLAPTLLALHPQPAEDACNPLEQNCLRHRLICLSRACLDAGHGYRNPLLLEFAGKFHALLAGSDASTPAIADLALSYVARSRQASDQFAKVYFTDTAVDYRDDNRHLWTFIEAGDEEESFRAAASAASDEPLGLPPRHYPEWDCATQNYRPGLERRL
jgi:nitric oxide reductase NorD protein